MSNKNSPMVVSIRTEKQKGGGTKVGLFLNEVEAQKAIETVTAAGRFGEKVLTDADKVEMKLHEEATPITFAEWKAEMSKEAELNAAIATLSPEMIERLRKAGAFKKGV